VNYIAYTIIGGKGSMLGPVVGGALLIWAGDLFALRGEYSQFLFGFPIVVVVLAAPNGIAGTIYRLASPILSPRRPARAASGALQVPTAAGPQP
jgi:branched-chain amino acid transport system permease protein